MKNKGFDIKHQSTYKTLIDKINSFDFTPIHNFIPQKFELNPGTNNQDPLIGNQQYIALANPNNGLTNWGFGNAEAYPSVNGIF